MTDTQIEDAAKFVRALADKHTHEIGFLPHTVYPIALAEGRLKIETHNGQPCGFILHGREKQSVRIYQTCVDKAVRLRDHGRELWLQSLIASLNENVEELTWICADDLPANGFWERVSGPPLALKIQRAVGRRELYQYRHVLPRGKEIEAYFRDQLEKHPGHKIARLQGLDDWIEKQIKERYRKSKR